MGIIPSPPDATFVFIKEGKYDAMAVYQGNGRPEVSLPNGCRCLSRVLDKYDNDCPVLYSNVVKERKCWGQFRDPDVEPENILTDLL